MTAQENGKNRLEWAIFALSCLLIAATLGFLLREGFRSGDHPADIRISLEDPAFANGGTRVPVKAVNLGGRSAQQVEIEVSAGAGRASVLVFDFLARGETREGHAVFAGSVSKRDLEARVLGYQEP